MNKIIIWRDAIVGTAATVGFPLWVNHRFHNTGFTIFACVFVVVVLVPRILHGLGLLLDDGLIDRHLRRAARQKRVPHVRADEPGANPYYNQQVGKEAAVFLFNLFHFNLDSRTHMANGIFNGIYKPIQQRQGDLSSLDEPTRHQLLDLVTLEIVSKAFMALEDLGKVLLSSGKQLRDFPNIVFDAAQQDSLAAITRFAQLSDKELLSAFPFIHPREYGLSGQEEAAVQRYNMDNSAALKARLKFLAAFVARHTGAYNKYKHGIPIVVGMQGQLLPPGVDGAIPILLRENKLELMLAGPIIVDKLLGVLGLTVELSKALVERRIQMIELGGKPPLLLCHTSEEGGKTIWVSWGLVVGDAVDRPVLDAAFGKVMSRANSTKLAVTFNVNIDHSKLQELVDYYFRDWHIE